MCISPLNAQRSRRLDKDFVGVDSRDSLAFSAETLVLEKLKDKVEFQPAPRLFCNGLRGHHVLCSVECVSAVFMCVPRDVASVCSGFRVINYTSRGDQTQLIGD